MQKSDYLKNIRDGQPLSVGEQLILVASLALPAMLANLSSVMMQYIDSSMVGRLGANGSASIGLVSTTTWLFGSMCLACSVGFTVQAAQRIGAKDNEGARKIMKLAYQTGLFLCILLAAAGLAIAPHLPRWLGGSEEIVRDASLYFAVFSAAIPLMFLRYLSGALLQASGNMKTPSMLNIAMCFLDVLFNYICIYRMRMGVVGAAAGTAMAEAVIAVCMLFVLLFRSPVFAIRRTAASERIDGNFRKNTLRRALKIALPVAAESIVTCGAQITTTVIIAPLGTASIAANSFSVTVESLCYMPCYGIAAAATTMIGQSVGAGRKDMAKSLGWLVIVLSMVVMVFTGTGMYLFAPTLIGLLSPVAEIRALGSAVLRIEAFAEPLYGASIVTSYVFRGAGDTLIPTLLMAISMWAVRIPLAAFLSGIYGLKGVWFAMATELSVRGLLFLGRMKRGKWVEG